MSVKTAVATSPSMCQMAYCEKEAVKLLVIQWDRKRPEVVESVYCLDDAETIQGLFEHDQFVMEYL